MENIREQSELLKIRLEQQELISEISRGFIASGDSETHAKEAIAKLGHYHNVSLVFIFSIDYKQNTTRPAHHWSADGLPPRMVKFDLLGLIRSNFPEWLPDCSTVPVISCEDIAASPVEAFHELLTADVCAFICAPLYVEGHLWGALAVEQCHTPRHWTYNEKSFVAMTASTIAGVIMRDIYNTMLKDALQKATVASRAKGEFLSNMSHEMRTPLNAIIGMTAIGKNAANMERKNYALTKIEDASTHLLGVINDVLDMSKIEANKLELSYIEFDFERMLQKVVSVINFRVEEKKQKLLVNVDPAIPKILIGDDQRLAQVVTNLLANAVKFTPENGSITLDARFLGEEDSKGTEGSKGTNGSSCIIQVSVTDTGIGISPEQQAKLFQSFQQAESSTVRKYGGTGLGLSISKNIVEMMGGKIWVESKPAKGSTFAFTIQAKRGEEKNQDIHDMSKEQQADEITEGVFAGHCILLAEDVEINREIVLTLLEPTLLEIDCAENGTQAVNMFIEKPDKYRMIFMDVQMPEMDGYDATRRIRSFEAERKGKTGKQVPIIAMTANVFKEDIDRCLEAGMNDHVGKPLDFGIVLEKLRTYLQKSGNIN
ncbi:MAG: response regulator [Treponema sp.]|nr:response regulator [Treponema sp.]